MAKRLLDILLAAIALLLMLPVLAAVAAAVAISMGRPVLFRQTRVGLGGRDFELRKFRSMADARGADGRRLPDEQRITAVGRFLRRYRLDELPELWLILKGDMSFVGPRPLPRPILEAWDVVERRSRVRPGLTGLAQVSGNTLLTNDEKFAIDIFYSDTRSMVVDLKIIVDTVKVIAAGEKRDQTMIARAIPHANHLDRRR